MSDQQWHLDKRVPIALIFGMVGQVVVVVWGLAVMYKDIEANRKSGVMNASNIQLLDARVRSSEASSGAQAVQLGRIEEAIRGQRDTTERILNMLETLTK